MVVAVSTFLLEIKLLSTPNVNNYIFNFFGSGNLFPVNLKNRFSFLTELSSQSRRPGLPPSFPEHGGARSLSDDTAPDSRLIASRASAAAAGRVLRGVWFQTRNNEYRPLEQSVGGVVKADGFFIGRNDRGVLRPIFNQRQEMIKVDAVTGRQLLLNSSEAVQLGMNLPIAREDLISARIAARRIIRERNN